MDEEDYEVSSKLESSSRVISILLFIYSQQNLIVFQRSNYNILSRRSLSRTRQHVQFQDAARFSSSFSDQGTANKSVDNTFDEKVLHTSYSNDTNTSKSSKDTIEEYYSPNECVDDKDKTEKNNHNKLETNLEVDKEEIDSKEINSKIEIVEDIQPKLTQSPRARRSYKRK